METENVLTVLHFTDKVHMNGKANTQGSIILSHRFSKSPSAAISRYDYKFSTEKANAESTIVLNDTFPIPSLSRIFISQNSRVTDLLCHYTSARTIFYDDITHQIYLRLYFTFIGECRGKKKLLRNGREGLAGCFLFLTSWDFRAETV
jgi:hypothetical protein